MPRANKSKKNKQPVSHPTTKHVAVAKEKIQHQRQQADTRTTKEIEAAKKAHKDQKRIRKKRENGGVVHNDEDYQRIRAQLQEATERNNYPLERPRTF
ncbi:hypothetical protein HII31_10310 [Pseudocercospora fuligena]|uniref:Uncharacterized protein n=1 Tax=Pseudocercospora fuligena TaxID=685502 RepID=A0A8H6RCU4_9PEZI|nr:hypothetical protein HII31_10310 [Pseudocercospora fuligena]